MHRVFEDLEKAFDKISRRVIRWAVRRQLIPERLVHLLMSLYIKATSKVKIAGVTSETFDRCGCSSGVRIEFIDM